MKGLINLLGTEHRSCCQLLATVHDCHSVCGLLLNKVFYYSLRDYRNIICITNNAVHTAPDNGVFSILVV